MNRPFLHQQYIQCNEHLREQAKKRDLILGSYVTISIAVYGLEGFQSDKILFFWIMCGVVIMGLLLGGLLTAYRGWHGIYVTQAIVIQQLIHNNNIRDQKLVRNAKYSFFSVISVEFLVFIIVHALLVGHLLMLFRWGLTIASPSWLLWHFTFPGWPSSMSIADTIIIALASLTLLEFATHFFGMYLFTRFKRATPFDDGKFWMLQGLFNEEKVDEARNSLDAPATSSIKITTAPELQSKTNDTESSEEQLNSNEK